MSTPNEYDVPVDVQMVKGENGMYDISVADNGDLTPVYSFDTSILVSLLCDARADDNEIAIAMRRSGWLGNENADVPGFEIGGKLWMHWNMARQTANARNAIVDAARDALAWIVPDFADDLLITGKLTTEGVLLEITVKRKAGKTDKLYFRLWELTGSEAA